jgi:hypothetical protein
MVPAGLFLVLFFMLFNKYVDYFSTNQVPSTFNYEYITFVYKFKNNSSFLVTVSL